MPVATVCHRHQTLIPAGETCAECAADEHARRRGNNARLGRNSMHWRRLRTRALKLANGICSYCGGRQNPRDTRSKLTVDLIRGHDHARATLADVRVSCLHCHGTKDGGRARRAA